jgi:uncharacterized protein YjbJ (UPF0337 family)
MSRRTTPLKPQRQSKEAVGRASDDERFELEGKIEQVDGHPKQAGEKVKDALKSGTNRKEH